LAVCMRQKKPKSGNWKMMDMKIEEKGGDLILKSRTESMP
jgi:hypothetical protein